MSKFVRNVSVVLSLSLAIAVVSAPFFGAEARKGYEYQDED